MMARLLELLETQRKVSAALHSILAAEDGLIADTHATTKNLEAAIAQSRVPGYWKYHKPSDKTRAVEEKHVIDAKTHEIAALQEQIDKVREDIAKVRAAASTPAPVRQVASLDEWMRVQAEPFKK